MMLSKRIGIDFRIAGLLVLTAALGAKEIVLQPGVIELHEPMVIDPDEEGVLLKGAPGGTTLRASSRFRGEALLVARGVRHLSIQELKLDGNRAVLERAFPIAPYDKAFADFYPLNGLLLRDCEGVIVSRVEIRDVVNFPVLVYASKQVRILHTKVEASGSRDDKGKNNTTGGILFEEGTADFEVRFVKMGGVRGNGIWTHSRYESPRNRDGLIWENEINGVARDAIQVGHAVNVRVLKNVMANVGYPADLVDMANGGIPVGIDTAGNVERSVYAENLMREINGKCLDLDGFHHGEVRANRCFNLRPVAAYPQGHFGLVMNNTNPDMRSESIVIEDNEFEGMKFGGMFLVGRNHVVRRNRMRYLNLAGCTESHGLAGSECYFLADEPDMLRTGIYLGKGAERPDVSEANLVEDNLVMGHKMKERCVGYSPAVKPEKNRVGRNVCLDGDASLRGKKKQ
jgi:hypothetical protein